MDTLSTHCLRLKQAIKMPNEEKETKGGEGETATRAHEHIKSPRDHTSSTTSKLSLMAGRRHETQKNRGITLQISDVSDHISKPKKKKHIKTGFRFAPTTRPQIMTAKYAQQPNSQSP
jgi:hypothetical protein